jgi:hypothetical protein
MGLMKAGMGAVEGMNGGGLSTCNAGPTAGGGSNNDRSHVSGFITNS